MHEADGILLTLTSDNGDLECQGATYRNMFWPYRDARVLIQHPRASSEYVQSISISDTNMTMVIENLAQKMGKDKATAKKSLDRSLQRIGYLK